MNYCEKHGQYPAPIVANSCPACIAALSAQAVGSTATAEDVELMLQTIKAQQNMIVAYRVGKLILPEWVLETIAKAETKGWLK